MQKQIEQVVLEIRMLARTMLLKSMEMMKMIVELQVIKKSIPAGAPPKMSSDDKALNWQMMDMRFKIWLKRVPMLNEILIEEIGRSDDEIAAQKQKF